MSQALTLPKIGEQFQDGTYGGLSVTKAGEIYIPILSPLRAPKGTHKQQLAWAEKNGLSLLNKAEAALFFQNIPDQFEKDWHWLEEPFGSDGAYYQGFASGYQYWDYRSNKFLGRGVRRLTLGSFDPLGSAQQRAASDVAALLKSAQALVDACTAASVLEAV